MTPNTLSDVADKVMRQIRPAGEIIIRQGEVGAEFFIVRSGTVEIFKDDETGRRLVATLKEADHFGEAALLTGQPRNATVIAKEKTELYSLNKRDFQAAIDHQLSLREELLNVYSARH
jgi:CRP-like cAMP-binding protein